MGQEEFECSSGVCRRVGVKSPLRLGVFDVGTDYVLLEWNSTGSGFTNFQVDIHDPEWRELSKSLKGPFIKKKGLQPSTEYSFRIRGFDDKSGKWGEFSDVVSVATLSSDAINLKPTNVKVVFKEVMDDGSNNKMKIEWNGPTGNTDVESYALEYRQMSETGKPWILASDKIKHTQVIKKNISPGSDWVFRVRARYSNSNNWGPWSSPTEPTSTVYLQKAFVNLLGNDNGTLVKGSQLSPVYSSSLAGKIVALYFSASWCPPCRQFTPMLIQFYNSLVASGQPFEVIFVSADRDEASFKEYFKKMPWLAIKYSSPRRQGIQASYQVNGIPNLKVFGPNGNLISANAVQEPLNYSTFQRWQSMA
uniref:protein-disulfide reductase n=1 Tax=Aplanochytrium stocchinoi TaxID=215587 RepID=A0A7S3LFW5_9STRA|mmetsp:Transcript_14206/g.16477  ORF Transcript_14206/g.16477 Transcript_14206/m.16477 type:complete len:363 (+) Transcript_14206:264-1352(+)|eukprot:CAMPEP_0204832306 /NCGR_PEP_ID=MMETSP1346-20131115/13135_1 /ASSEMBLY_ACC=CAM_ASM_000771 /TAXON_ID=215587 /ORGANISM="Aplanochytrium stocchinoi, Strain GSBS06" /LENGTH=362 /DNA_ID=CAMNT_0051964009 /DNA_START=207 /DNA_END=1295 /DNA_ORIENTATION=+